MRIAIIGAGAAGCFAAANIPNTSGHQVTIFEKTGKVLQKVKISGGGRCNVTNACFEIPELLKCYPRGKQLLRKSLYQFTPKNTIEWFESRGVKLKTEADGRIFPITDDSQTIIDCIWKQMMYNKTEVLYHKAVKHIKKQNLGFIIYFEEGSEFYADKILIGTGGFPKIAQYGWIRELGHTIRSPIPSLFTFNIQNVALNKLMGISVASAAIKIEGTKLLQKGPILITHWGLSGPAVLKLSAWAARELNESNYDFTVGINWLGASTDADVAETFGNLRKEEGKKVVSGKNPFNLPGRLWEYFLLQSGISADTRWGDLKTKEQNNLMRCLLHDDYHVKGKTTFKEEFVTSGGVNLAEINPATMESRIVAGLYFAGEIMDVDGITGGFNFQHAWSSAYIAAKNIVL
jgi:predicted Rossmann fold flavoprotein